MPLSRFTQTCPLDLAEAIWPSEAAPVDAVFVVFGAADPDDDPELIAFDDVAAGALELLAGALAGAAAGADAGAEAGAEPEAAVLVSLAADFFDRLFLVVVLAPVSVAAVALPDAGAALPVEPEAAVVSLAADFLDRLFLVVVDVDESPPAAVEPEAAD